MVREEGRLGGLGVRLQLPWWIGWRVDVCEREVGGGEGGVRWGIYIQRLLEEGRGCRGRGNIRYRG